MTMMKRMRENQEKDTIPLANSLMLLTKSVNKSYVSMEFECKTCNKKFSSFQALGGHRASHKRQKVIGDQELRSDSKKPKMHECNICGQEFSLGQALGGHMRKHRAASTNEGFSSVNNVIAKVPVFKRSNSKRVMCLDLNLTPLENDLKLLFGNKGPQVYLSLF
ncbi:hypothetical protein TanjilG_02362 [Lupinus angustifolius]|uniref:C2H2-type domain-containing protein n=1 Tax=Lupinus angustifolius TaxID=3871 RepID=A0A394DDZ9_LUPAN|nr:PREDICTED: zinc finger protein ZAT11-like [Lupinus angustifolius]OIW21365.1 hypothetical protein TanjilG_02362 [Lupinus angustifolius]